METQRQIHEIFLLISIELELAFIGIIFSSIDHCRPPLQQQSSSLVLVLVFQRLDDVLSLLASSGNLNSRNPPAVHRNARFVDVDLLDRHDYT